MSKQSTTKGFAILSMTGFICKILALIYIPIQTAIVGNVGNSVISNGYRIYVFMFSLANLGIPTTISKLISEQNELGNFKGSKKIFKMSFVLIMVISLIFAVLLAISSKWIATEIRQPEAYLMFITLSPVFIFTGINCALRGYFQGRKNMIPTAISQLVEQIFNSVLTVILVYTMYNYTKTGIFDKLSNAAAGSAFGTLAGAFCATLFLCILFFVIRKQRKKEELNQSYIGKELSNKFVLKQLFLYSIPSIIATLGSSAADLIDATNCVRRMIESGISEELAKNINGQYTTAYQRTLSLSIFIVTALVAAIVPAIASANRSNDKKLLKHKIKESFRALFLFMAPALVGFTFLAKPIITFIFFNVNQDGSIFLSAWGWSNILFGIITIQSAILIGIGKPVIAPVSLIFGMLIKLFINFFLISIPSVNMHGAAIGTAVGWFISLAINSYFINKELKYKVDYLKLLFMPVACSIGMGIVSFISFYSLNFVFSSFIKTSLISNDISLVLAIFISIYIYAILLFKSKTLNKNELINLPMGNKINTFVSKMPIIKDL